MGAPDEDRRRLLKTGCGLGLFAALSAAGFIIPGNALAQSPEWNAAGFSAATLDEALRALGAAGSTESAGIRITAPDVSETGPAVAVAVTSDIPGTEAIALLVERNPTALSAVFDIPAGTDPFVNLNLRIAESGFVYALVRASGRYYHARRQVSLTVGGCGE